MFEHICNLSIVNCQESDVKSQISNLNSQMGAGTWHLTFDI